MTSRLGFLILKPLFSMLHTPNEETVIVRVPSILRASGACAVKYWVVDKALYGLDEAPRSWALHRNQVLAATTELCSGRSIWCLPMEEDASVWVVVGTKTDEIVTYLALYVDNIMMIGEPSWIEDVAKTLEGKGTTTPVTWCEKGATVPFDGFEVESHETGFWVHQQSYVKEILKQSAHVEGTCNVPCTKLVMPGSGEGRKPGRSD